MAVSNKSFKQQQSAGVSLQAAGNRTHHTHVHFAMLMTARSSISIPLSPLTEPKLNSNVHPQTSTFLKHPFEEQTGPDKDT